MNHKILFILCLIILPAAIAATTNQTLYYKIYPNNTMDIYDKNNFSINIAAINDSVERSFTARFNYTSTFASNTSSDTTTFFCGDTSLSCPAITFPQQPACPPAPTCPTIPAAPACPQQNEEGVKTCLETIKSINESEVDYTPYIIAGVLAVLIIFAVLMFKKGEGSTRPIIIQKKDAAQLPKPIHKDPIQKQRPLPEDGTFVGEYDEKPQPFAPNFVQEVARPQPKKVIEELRQEVQQQPARTIRPTLQEIEDDLAKQYEVEKNARRR